MRLFFFSLMILFSGLIGRAAGTLASILEPVTAEDLLPQSKVYPVEKTVEKKVPVEKPACVVHVLTQAEILEVLTQKLSTAFDPQGDLSLSLAQPWHPLKIKGEVWDLEISKMPVRGLAPRMILLVDIIDEEGLVYPRRLVLNCRLLVDAYQAKKSLGIGDKLNLNDFEIVHVDALARRSRLVQIGENLSDYELDAYLAEGKTLSWKYLVPRPVIRKGQIVEVVAIEGLMQIKTNGVAMEDGLIGDMISVRNLTTHKEIKAEVLHENRVQVHF